MQSDREDGGANNTEVNIYQPEILLHDKERSGHIIPLKTHEEKAFEAIRTGNIELLSVLLHDGLDYERSLIRSVTRQLFEESTKLVLLAYKKDVYKEQLKYLSYLMPNYQKEVYENAYMQVLAGVMKKYRLRWTEIIDQNISNGFVFKGAIVSLRNDTEKKVCQEEFDRKLQDTEIALALPDQLDLRTCQVWKEKIENEKRACETELATFRSEINELERMHHNQRKRLVGEAISSKQREHHALISTPEKALKLCDEYKHHSAEMLYANVSPNAKLQNGETLLHAAIAARKPNMVHLLMERGALPFEVGPVLTEDGIIEETAFSQACKFAQKFQDTSMLNVMLIQLNRVDMKKWLAQDILEIVETRDNVAINSELVKSVIKTFADTKAKLDNYAQKLPARIVNPDVVDSLLYSLHTNDRIQDLSQYYQALAMTFKTGNLSSFKGLAREVNDKAHRGLLGRSELHASVSEILNNIPDLLKIQAWWNEREEKRQQKDLARARALGEFEAKISGEAGELRAKLEVLQRKYDRESQSNAEKIERLEEDKKVQLVINAQLTSQMAQLEIDKTTLTKDITEVKTDNQKLTSQMAGLTEKNERLTADLAEKNKTIIRLTQDIDKQTEINTITEQKFADQSRKAEEQNRINKMLMDKFDALEQAKEKKKEKKEQERNKSSGFFN